VSRASDRRGFISLAVLTSVMLLASSGCATQQPEGSEKWQESQHTVLKSRVDARWDALIKGNFEKAYSFTTPDYRDVVSLQQDKSKYGRVLVWREARVVNVSYDVPTVATVSVAVTYQIELPGAGGAIETQKVISEKWIYKNREWWYTAS